MTLKIIAALAAIVILVGIAAWFYRQGSEAVLISIERQNNASGDKSDRARTDYDRCLAGGGVFDFATGKCRGPAPRGRN